MQQRYDQVLANNGFSLLPLPGVLVTVLQYPSLTPAVIYSDNGITPKANPVTTDSEGTYTYYAANGKYIEMFSYNGSNITPSPNPTRILYDPTGITANTQAVANINALRAATIVSLSADVVTVPTYYGAIDSTPDGSGNTFQYDNTDTTSTDNGVTIIVDASNRRWKALNPTAINILQAGAKRDSGATDNTLFFQKAAAALVLGGLLVIPPGSGYFKVTDETSLNSGTAIQGYGNPEVLQSTAGKAIFKATSKNNLRVEGVYLHGAVSSTVDLGLINFQTCSNIKIYGNETSTSYWGINVTQCTNAEILWNNIHDFGQVGVVGSQSIDSSAMFNWIHDCTQAGAFVAYGVEATGDQAGGHTQKNFKCNYNVIENIPSWDAFGSHDCDGLEIIGNFCRNVRHGIDVGHLVSTNVVKNVNISFNYVESTTTNTWGATPAAICGIETFGADPTHRIDGLTIQGNTIRGFFNTAMTAAGDPGNIAVEDADHVTISGNTVADSGAVPSGYAGIYLHGTFNDLTVQDNSLQGDFIAGGIRFDAVTANIVAVGGSTINQTTAANAAIVVTGSTLPHFSLGDNATNSTIPFSKDGGSTIGYSGPDLQATETYDPPNIANGSSVNTVVALTGVNPNDFAEASFSNGCQGISLTATCESNSVRVVFSNLTGGAIDLASGTLAVRVRRSFL